MSTLVVDYIDLTFQPGAQLSFGRSADLTLDADNGYLHRQAGRFRNIGGVWWLENSGSRLRLKMVSADGSVIDLQAGASAPVAGPSGIVSLVAGPTRYELAYSVQQSPMPDFGGPGGAPTGEVTATYGTALTPREIDFMVVLAENRLTGVGGPLPSQSEIASLWGVSKKTVDNTLQRLRVKLRNNNVRRLDTSEMLVEYMVSQGFITMRDLEWAAIREPIGPRSAADKPPTGSD